MSRTPTIDPLEVQPSRPVIFGEILFDCFEDRQLHAQGRNPLPIPASGAMIRNVDPTRLQHDMRHGGEYDYV